MPSQTSLEPIARLTVVCADPIDVGPTAVGFSRVIPIIGGTVSGPEIFGEVLAIGADWNIEISPEGGSVSAKYLIRTDDGVILTVNNSGYIGSVPDTFGFTRPHIEAPAGRYEWINRAVLVGTLEQAEPDNPAAGVALVFYRALRAGS